MKRDGAAWGVALVLLFVVAYADPLFVRRNFGGRDLLAYNLPMEKAVHDAYARGRLPVWMPEVSGGRPLLPNPNAGALYPVRLFLSKIPFPAAIRIFPPLHWALAALGVLCLLSSLGATPPAAWVGAMTYAFSGVAVSEVFYPHILPGLALLPWIVWAVARRWSSERTRVLVLAFLFALEMLAGDVFSIALSGCAAVLWILLEEDRPRRLRLSIALAGAVVLAALLAAPQVVATVFWVRESARAVSGLKLRESLLFTIRPPRLLEFLVPYPFGPTFALNGSEVWGRAVFSPKASGLFSTLYCGAFALVAAVALARRGPRGARFARALFLIAIGAACLPSLIPASWGRWNSPLPLRNPEKFAVGIVFALSLFGGLAYDRFRSAPPRRRVLLAGAVLLALAAGAGWIWPEVARAAVPGVPAGSPRTAHAEGRKLAVALAEGGLFWTATFFGIEALRRRRPAGTAISVALLTLVPIAANRRIARTFSDQAIFAPTAIARVIARADPNGMYRTMGVYGFRPGSALELAHASSDPGQIEFNRRRWSDYMPVLWGRGQVFNWDFDAGELSRYHSLRTLAVVAAGNPDSQAFFGSLALRWSVHYRDQDALPGYHRIAGDSLMDLDEHEHAYPDIRLLTNWREENGTLEALGALPGLGPGEVVIESGARRDGAARPGRLQILEKSPERLRIIAQTPDPTWLFVLRGYWTHRTILLDGAPVEDSPAQLAFSALPLPAGTHRIEWKERVPGGTTSRWGPVLFLLVGAAWTLRDKRPRSEV